ncbi:MAG: acyl-CoA dehydrogenase family protein [Cohaesibacter sp.]|nr:acyl-CoA dehydrogenase family protein [Cohaesibacter sp.]
MSNPEAILDAARSHATHIIKPQVNEWNKQGDWPRAASDLAAKDGLLGLYCPVELGGQGLSLADGIQVYEELGKGDGAYAFALSMHNICSYALCGFGTEAAKDKWARDLTSGKQLAGFVLTEPQSGSDPMTMYTKAEIDQESGAYRICGRKAWVSLATEADVYFVVVKTSDIPGHQDMAMIAVPADAPGVRFGPRYETASFNFLPLADMYLDDVHVPAENIILPPGKGLSGSLMAIDIARASIASGCCGLMEAALDTALSFAKQRSMFGGKELDLEGIQWMMADIATDLEISRLLYKKAAGLVGTPEGALAAAHAKRFAPDAALKAANACTQMLGGYGLLKQYDLDRLSRLAQMLKLVDGTTEIQRVVIARSLIKRAKDLDDVLMP